jgi:hypothetical protein
MIRSQPSIRMLERRREAKRKQLAAIGPVVQGSLVAVKHKTCKHIAHLLTFPVKGKTKSVYVPLDMVQEVQQWSRNYRNVKALLRASSNLSLALIHRHVPVQRAVAKSRAKRRPNP